MTPSSRPRFWNDWPAAAILLAVYFLMGLSASWHLGATADETAHLTAGYRYWQTTDFQLQPENGNLPQRWAALPILLSHFNPPPLHVQDWNIPNVYYVGDMFFYHDNNDPARMLFLGRAAIGLLGIATGIIVYACSRSLFGPAGGILSLILFAFSPMMLGHGFLATSDAAATLFFTASSLSIWKLLHRVTGWTLILGCLSVAGLALSKFSAPLIIPIAGILLAIRLFQGAPLKIRNRLIVRRMPMATAFMAIALIHIAAAVFLIWAFYCFRYNAYVSPMPKTVAPFLSGGWDWAFSSGSIFTGIVRFCRKFHLLPEAYLYGFIHTIIDSQYRQSFLNGSYFNRGSVWYFPYAFLVKTPLALFIILILAARAVRGRQILYQTAPLWILILIYWCAAISSHLNIGLRHLMPTYPAMFILAGAAATYLQQFLPRPVKIVLAASVAWFIAESFFIRPYYIEYFNELTGGPKNGYRHLVDSSLDWGQDLPALKTYLDQRGIVDPSKAHVYLAYFGVGSPVYHQIPATILPGFGTSNEERVYKFPRLKGGIYCISATLLEGIYADPGGPWTAAMEAHYWKLRNDFDAMNQMDADPKTHQLFKEKYWVSPERFNLYRQYHSWRAARLFAYLRHRRPDAQAGYSILIFNLSDQEAFDAVFGPPVELVDRSPFSF